MCGCPTRTRGLTPIPAGVSDRQALFVGDLLATRLLGGPHLRDNSGRHGAADRGRTHRPCSLECVLLKQPQRVIVCEKIPRGAGSCLHYPPRPHGGAGTRSSFVRANSPHGGADRVIEGRGRPCHLPAGLAVRPPERDRHGGRPYDEPQILPLPDMYGKT